MLKLLAETFSLTCLLLVTMLAFQPPPSKPTCKCLGECVPDPCVLYGWDSSTGALTKEPF